MSDDSALQPTVTAQYEALADLLASASDATWDHASLCEGWRVREVVAHMTMPARYSNEEFMAELERLGFDFTRLSNEVAARDAKASTAELIANLRSDVLHQWMPPGGGHRGALNHVVIHSLDITVPLGEARLASDETMRAGLDALTVGGGHEHFGITIDGRLLEATDLDWQFGAGEVLRAPAQDLALALTGRVVPNGRIEGTPLRRRDPAEGS